MSEPNNPKHLRNDEPPSQPSIDGIQSAQLNWDDDGQPISSVFGDVYFSKANGLEETRHVFLHHNHLHPRWQALGTDAAFTIGETGFGTGLNFLAAWQLWDEVAPATARLHVVSVEKFPLARADLARALSLWPELSQYAESLIHVYPRVLHKGFHRIQFDHGRVTLTLIIDDAEKGFEQLLATTDPEFASDCARIDAWFLDGFAPSKNPQMWSEALFTRISQLSHPGSTAATFSAAAIVKNGLKYAGFAIEKVAGFGRKREMIRAAAHALITFDGAAMPKPRSYSPYPLAWSTSDQPAVEDKNALIIGSGIAGASTARALAERGYRVTVLEKNATIAQGASGNTQGALYAKLSPKEEMQAAFNLTSFQYALRYYKDLISKTGPEAGDLCGLLQLAHDDAERTLHDGLKVNFENHSEFVQFASQEIASALAGVDVPFGGLYFPESGWLSPAAVCRYQLDHPNIQLVLNTEVNSMTQTDGIWDINHGQWRSPIVVIAAAQHSLSIIPQSDLPAKAIRGQVTHLEETAQSNALNTVICAEGYIAPAANGHHCMGATFNLRDTSTLETVADHHSNWKNLSSAIATPDVLWPRFSAESAQGRVGFRCSFPDYLPAIGPVPDIPRMVDTFAPLRKNARAPIWKKGHYLSGLFVNMGHGSRGLAYTPLCAELLASLIAGDVLPVPREMATALNPARFVIRDLIKNKR